ncbi:MAG: hypothetical protein U0401_29240 [Anaerolineae bacterium]
MGQLALSGGDWQILDPDGADSATPPATPSTSATGSPTGPLL